MVTRKRWGKDSKLVEAALIKQSRRYKIKKTGKKVRFIKSFAPIAEKYGVSRELVRQIATDLGIRSMYRLKGRGKKHGSKVS